MTAYASEAIALERFCGAQCTIRRERCRIRCGKASARGGSKGLTIGIVVAAVVAVAGIALWIVQLTGGMVQTGMRNMDSWGLYITMFMFFVGLSAGGLTDQLRSEGVRHRGIRRHLQSGRYDLDRCHRRRNRIRRGRPRPADAAVGTVRLFESQFAAHVGHCRHFHLPHPELRVPVGAGQAEKGKVSHAALRVISAIALVCAVLVHSVTAWIFGLQQGREMWHTALLAPWFVSSALVCGTALVMCASVALRAVGYLVWNQANLVRLAKLLGAFVVVDLYFFGCDLLTEAFPAGSGTEVVEMLTTGPLAPFFWIEVVGCAVCAVICLVPNLRTTPLLVVASLLAIVGIFCKRVQLLVGGFQLANLDLAGFLTSSSLSDWEVHLLPNSSSALVYCPTPLEFGVTIGVIALGFLVFFLGIKFLPLKPAE